MRNTCARAQHLLQQLSFAASLPHAGHKGKIHGLTFIGSGTLLFSASKDKTIREWDLMRNEERRVMEGEHSGPQKCSTMLAPHLVTNPLL